MFWGDMLGGAASGAGTGAMLGTMGGPFGVGAGAVGGAIIGAGMGHMKGKAREDEFQRQNELAARTAELSPWTGLRPQSPTRGGGGFQSAIKGIGAGASMYGAGQKFQNQQALSNQMKQNMQVQRMGRPGGYWSNMGGQPSKLSYASTPGYSVQG